jgi:parallel beta-helix repeat protein
MPSQAEPGHCPPHPTFHDQVLSPDPLGAVLAAFQKGRWSEDQPGQPSMLNGIETRRGPWGSPMPLSRCHCSHCLWSGIIVRSSAQNRLSGTTISGSTSVKALPATPLSNTRRFIEPPYLSAMPSLWPVELRPYHPRPRSQRAVHPLEMAAGGSRGPQLPPEGLCCSSPTCSPLEKGDTSCQSH